MSIIEKKIEELTKKTPHFKSWFIETYKKDKVPFSLIEEIYNKLRTYKELLREHKLNILEKTINEEGFKSYRFQTFESLDDKLTDIIVHNERKKYALSFISKKYKHLLDNDSLDLFYEIKKMNLPHEKVNEVLKKIAAYKEPKDLNEALNKFIDLHSQQDILKIKEKINKYNAKVSVEDHEKNVIIAEIEDYSASQALGSSQWCISYNRSYFDRYLKGELFRNRQFFLWDFDKKGHHKEHRIGFTVDFNGKVTAAHYQDDSSVNKNSINTLIQRYNIEFSTLSTSEILKEIHKNFKNHGARIKSIIKYTIDADCWEDCHNYYKTSGKDFVIADLIVDKVNTAKKAYFSNPNKDKPEEKVIIEYLKYLSNVVENVSVESGKKWKDILKYLGEKSDFSLISHFLNRKDDFIEEEQKNLKIFFELQYELNEFNKLVNKFQLNINEAKASFENKDRYINSIFEENLNDNIKLMLFINYLTKNGSINENVLNKVFDLVKEKSEKEDNKNQIGNYLFIASNIMNSVVHHGNSNNLYLKRIYNEIISENSNFSFDNAMDVIYQNDSLRKKVIKNLFENPDSRMVLGSSEIKALSKNIKEVDINVNFVHKNSFKYIKELNNEMLNNYASKNMNAILSNMLIGYDFELFKEAYDFTIKNIDKEKVINKSTIVSAIKEYNKNQDKKEFLEILYSNISIKDLKYYESALKENRKDNIDYKFIEDKLKESINDLSLEDFLYYKNDIIKQKLSRKRVFKKEEYDFMEQELSKLPHQIKDEKKVIKLVSELLVNTKNHALIIIEDKLPENIILRAIEHENKDPLISYLSKKVNKLNQSLNTKKEIGDFLKNKQEKHNSEMNNDSKVKYTRMKP